MELKNKRAENRSNSNAIEELQQLAHMLHVGAELGRDVAAGCPQEFETLLHLAGIADELAGQVRLIASRLNEY